MMRCAYELKLKWKQNVCKSLIENSKHNRKPLFDARQRDIEAGNLPTGPSAGMTEMTSPMPRMRPSNLGG